MVVERKYQVGGPEYQGPANMANAVTDSLALARACIWGGSVANPA